jgi:hypothetical protein
MSESKRNIEESTGLTMRQIWEMTLPEIREHMRNRRGEAPAESEASREVDRVLGISPQP